MSDGFPVAPRQRVPCRLVVIKHCPPHRLPSFKVQRQFHRDLASPYHGSAALHCRSSIASAPAVWPPFARAQHIEIGVHGETVTPPTVPSTHGQSTIFDELAGDARAFAYRLHGTGVFVHQPRWGSGNLTPATLRLPTPAASPTGIASDLVQPTRANPAGVGLSDRHRQPPVPSGYRKIDDTWSPHHEECDVHRR